MSSTIEQATLTAPDISCGHCVATVTRVVGGLQCVSTVSADEQTKQIKVAYDPAKVSLAQIEATLDEEGYPVKK